MERKRRRAWNKGIHGIQSLKHTKEWKRQASIRMKVNNPAKKEEARLKLSNKLKGNKNNLGKHLSKETKQKIGSKNKISVKRYFMNPLNRKRRSESSKIRANKPEERKRLSKIAKINWENPEFRMKMRERSTVRKNNKLELRVQGFLKENNILFETHKNIEGSPDIFIPSSNICLFIDGCYWHGCHHCNKNNQSMNNVWYRDFSIKHNLELEGYKVIRLWEHDINNPEFNIQKYLKV